MWNSRTIGILRELVAKGYTARRIAQELGPPFTRNAVVGKRHRLGINPGNVVKTETVKIKPAPPPVVAVITPTEPTEPTTKPITFDELTHETCRYPVSGEGRSMLFCASPTTNRVYCSYHQKLTRVSGSSKNYTATLKSLFRPSRQKFKCF